MTKPIAQAVHSDENRANHYPPLFIILNAGSGDKNAESVQDRLAVLFNEAQQPYELFLCSRPDDLKVKTKQAIEQAMQSNGAVVAAGGDGTIRFIAQEVLAAGLLFGVIAQGTFNYFARDNALPQELEAAVEVLISGVRAGCERPVQVGLLNDEVFLVNASLGLYPQLLEDREKFKQQHGRSRVTAKLAALLTLFRRDSKMMLRTKHGQVKQEQVQQESEDNVMPTSTIFVGNNALQLDDVGLNEEAKSLQKGKLAIIALPPMNTLERAAIAFRGMLGMLAKAPNLTHFASSQLIVEPQSRRQHKAMKVAMDGEVSKMLPPLVFRVGPQSLRLIVSPSAGVET